MTKMLYTGIDASKGYADYVTINELKQVVGDFSKAYDIKEGHEKLRQHIAELNKKYEPKQIIAALESTGGVENNWLNFLYSLKDEYPIKVARLNPNVVHQYQKTALRLTKTDRTSSLAIAEYLSTHSDRVHFYEPDRYEKIRSSSSVLQLMIKQKTQYSNSLHMTLYNVFPQIIPYCKNGLTKSTLKLLLLYPSAAHMAKAKFGGKSPVTYYTLTALNKIKDKCEQRVLQDVDELAAYEVECLAEEILRLEEKIELFTEKLIILLPEKQVELIQTIPGIAKRSAVYLLSIIGDINRFESADKMVSYFGLYPVLAESGDMKKQPRLCRKGNKLVRKTLFMCVLSSTSKNPYWKKLYQRHLNKGKSNKSALCAMMAKLLRVIYGVLKHQNAYDPQIDMAYRDRFKPVPKEESVEKIEQSVEELQTILTSAPISKRYTKMVKEQSDSLLRTRSPECADCP